MFGLTLGRDKFKRVAIVDVGSASAAVGVMDVSKEGKSKLVAAHRSFIPYEKRTKEQFAARMGSAIEEASTKAMQALAARKDKSTAKVSDAYVFFRAPWIDAQVERLSKDFGEETKITREHIDTLAKQALSSQQKLLEAMVLRVELNGYATPDAVGQTAHLVTLFALVSTVDPDLQASALQYVQKALPHLSPTWRSHTRALLSWVREHPKHPRNCVIIDISSEGSSMLVIRDGILDSQVTFDFGVHAMLEKLSQNALPEETLGLLRMLEREQCSGDACDTLRKNMEKIEQEMVRTFGEQLAALSAKARLPQELLLFVHPDISPWLMRFFSRLDFAQFTVPLQPFAVSELASKEMQDWIEIDSAQPDISLLLAASLVHIESRGGN
jgi:hypothetical protein